LERSESVTQQVRFQRWEIVPAVIVCGGALLWALPTLNARELDFGMAYRGWQAAWASGHAEAVHTWMSTSFLAVVMAAVAGTPRPDVASRNLTKPGRRMALRARALPPPRTSHRRHVGPARYGLSSRGPLPRQSRP
jgi:hypothetical protein